MIRWRSKRSRTSAALADTPPAEDEVRTALRQLLDDPRFAASKRNRRFLAYVVEEELRGRGQDLKAYRVAVEAFRRPPDFDSYLDPIVRIEAGRLRRSLDEYYEAHPSAAALQISIPKGAYRPRFERTVLVGPEPPPIPDAAGDNGPLSPAPSAGASTGARADRKRRPLMVVALLGAVLVAAVSAGIVRQQTESTQQPAPDATSAPALLVEPFAVLDGDTDTARLALGL